MKLRFIPPWAARAPIAARFCSQSRADTTSMKQRLLVVVHILVGCVAFALALYYLMSNTLSFELPSATLAAARPRIFVTACFGFAAASLLFSARRRDRIAYRLFGYGSIGVGLFTLWLIFNGMETSAV